jgi:CubicO group peptidase (beta-lactamase class C family)
MRRPFLAAVTLVALPLFVARGVVAAPPAPARSREAAEALAVRRAVAALPADVRAILARTGVPGVAVAVVHDDRVLYAAGFGVRDVEAGGAVGPDTVFQIASISKPVSATVVAASLGRGALQSWETPVAPHLPGFALADAWVSEHVTVADLFAHRSGLPGGFGNDLEALGFGWPAIVARARLAPLAPFRASYAYSNAGLTMGALAAANAAGLPWHELAREAVFEPLRMTRTTFRRDALDAMTDVAALHQQAGGRWVRGPRRDASLQAPAGGASSTVNDLARWMRMILAGGTFEGKTVVPRAALERVTSLEVRTTPEPAARIGGYGLGLEVIAEDGEPVAWTHSGAFTHGAATQVFLVPSRRLGIVTLTNGWPIGAPEAINRTFVDRVLHGKPTDDHLATIGAFFAPFTTPTRTLEGAPRPAVPEPPAPLAAYAGHYHGDYFGDATVALEGDHLTLAMGPDAGTRGPLVHWNGDLFALEAPALPPGFSSPVRFTRAGAEVIAVVVGDPPELGTLTRVK